MSDTPRTDALRFKAHEVSEHAWVVDADDYGNMERELAAVKAERDACRKTIDFAASELDRLSANYSDAVSRCETLTEERDRMRTVVDCRLCQHFTTMTGGCISAVLCVDARQYKPTTPRRYWKESQK